MYKEILPNNVSLIIQENPHTPRIAITIFVKISFPEKKAGLYSLMNRMFLQGTTNRTAEQLADDLEENAIELSCDMQYDYLKFSLVCLNENLEYALEILQDVVQNTTFKDFKKEIYKLKGELTAKLDSPEVLARDNYIQTIFKGHFYGTSYTKILNSVDNITFADIQEAYKNIISNSYKVISVAGDKTTERAKKIIEQKFGFLQGQAMPEISKNCLVLNERSIVTITKEDAQQAQIHKGWLVPSIYNEEYAVFKVFNAILGASGLSSRLFLELRDKQGLAYSVRSRYETYVQGASFSVYIGTEPKNIKTALEGFDIEIDKLKQIAVSDDELLCAKNNVIGKYMFFSETNEQQAALNGLYEVNGKGYDYFKMLVEKINKVTKDDIQRIALKYFDENYVLSILAPKEFIKEL